MMRSKGELMEGVNGGSMRECGQKVRLEEFVGMGVRNGKLRGMCWGEKFGVKGREGKFWVVWEGEEMRGVWEYDKMYFECCEGVLGQDVEGEDLL